MPSAKRGEELRKIIKNIRNGTFEYDGRGKVKINWTKYDQAQIHELVDYLENVRDLVDEADRQIKERTPLDNPTLKKLIDEYLGKLKREELEELIYFNR